MTTTESTRPKLPLSKARVFQAAIAVADKGGLEYLTMRRLADELNVEAMSLYYHVDNKEAVLNGMADTIVEEIVIEAGGLDLPEEGADWRNALRARVLAARRVMLRHPWAPHLFETRTEMGFPVIKYFDSLLGILIFGGFSYDLAHHAMHALGSQALGFNQELFAPGDQADAGDESADMLQQVADEIPHIIAMMDTITHDDPETTLGWCDDQTEFEFGIDLLINGLEMLRIQEAG